MADTPVETEKPYAKCVDCDLDLADRDAMNAHLHDTVAPTGEAGVTARGHSARVVNPTEAEQRASQVQMRVQDALEAAYEDLHERVDLGEFTAAEVAENLWMFDLRDGWDSYTAEDDE